MILLLFVLRFSASSSNDASVEFATPFSFSIQQFNVLFNALMPKVLVIGRLKGLGEVKLCKHKSQGRNCKKPNTKFGQVEILNYYD